MRYTSPALVLLLHWSIAVARAAPVSLEAIDLSTKEAYARRNILKDGPSISLHKRASGPVDVIYYTTKDAKPLEAFYISRSGLACYVLPDPGALFADSHTDETRDVGPAEILYFVDDTFEKAYYVSSSEGTPCHPLNPEAHFADSFTVKTATFYTDTKCTLGAIVLDPHKDLAFQKAMGSVAFTVPTKPNPPPY
ncbi:hypothetical protein BGZ65_006767 [Modicella reniformis]|uniref:Uncharacterized protein n=1 Tax=Modicella reniformis TaxID=1440133 RepID=A0A9P6J5R3_9FUNG|nr:hypothetical protein BGZ65_006767 [Modicella reniformis]